MVVRRSAPPSPCGEGPRASLVRGVGSSGPDWPLRGDRVLAYAWVGVRHRGVQRGHDHLTERDQGPAAAQLRLPVAAPELGRENPGQSGFLTLGHEHHRHSPGAAGHLLLGVAQQRQGDRRPRPPIADLGQRVQGLASCLRPRGAELIDEFGDCR